MENVNVNDIVRLRWPYGYDHGCGFAVIKSKNARSCVANLVETRQIEYKVIDPIRSEEIVSSGNETNMKVTLLSSGTVKMSLEVKKLLDMTPRERGVSWSVWDMQPITEHSACD